MISFSCPRCNKALEVPEDQAGTKIYCPQCQQKLKVPLPPPPPLPSPNVTILGKIEGPEASPLGSRPEPPSSRTDSFNPIPLPQPPGFADAAFPMGNRETAPPADLASMPTGGFPRAAVDVGNEPTIGPGHLPVLNWKLEVIEGPDKGKVFPLVEGSTLQVGRGDKANVRLTDLHVSRKHCQVQLERGQATLTDFNSQGGTHVNDQPVSQGQLQPGDVLGLGETKIRVIGPGGAAPPPRAQAKTVEVICTTCQQVLKAREQYAGTQVACPSCATFLVLPGRGAFGHLANPAHLRSITAQLPLPILPPDGEEQPAPSGGIQLPRLTVYALIGLLILIVLVVLGATFWKDLFPGSPAN
jgi:pSer/pThr/pTyr-binding forkhead associated (FHA) protein